MTQPQPQPQPQTSVAAFDFDGTISTRDTFLPFLFRAFGWVRVLSVLLPLAGEGLRVLRGRASRDAFKARLIARLFTGVPVSAITPHGPRHAEAIRRWLRPRALARIEWHRAQGHRLVMVSASLELYLRDLAADLGFQDLLCTQLGQEGACFDGRMAGGNCRGAEKVKRLETLLGDLSQLEIHAYGDSDGDREMLEIAQHPFYRPFRD
ncbi:HAD hydrolase, family IB [Thiorhodovibrio winogradskyi]|uniref:HAD hydrolase, family IB n=1 Tax=Thiorhodovibrio winogradskyi TaxID=77007 RepID=A0ABZ0SH74_9GAMM|nr:HAD-IB family hydrolase [Thiorhodovibrio winogradskyi]